MSSRMRLPRLALSVPMLCCLASCEISLGPRQATEYVIARPGHPGTVVENVKVKLMADGASQPVEQDIGGWIVMPKEHFDALMRAVERSSHAQPTEEPPPAP